MERAVVWAVIILISIIVASFFLFIKPVFLRDFLRDQAQRVANTVAERITFTSRMIEEGCLNGSTAIYIDPGPGRHLEIVINDGNVTAVIYAGTVSGRGNATCISKYPVIAPPKIYAGKIIFTIKNRTKTDDFVIYVTNLKS